jgi:hypothetical protein
MTNITKLAEELHAYMRFRATREGAGYGLSPEFFRGALKKGVGSFFGVEVGEGDLLRDRQNTQCFAEWKSVPARPISPPPYTPPELSDPPPRIPQKFFVKRYPS